MEEKYEEAIIGLIMATAVIAGLAILQPWKAPRKPTPPKGWEDQVLSSMTATLANSEGRIKFQGAPIPDDRVRKLSETENTILLGIEDSTDNDFNDLTIALKAVKGGKILGEAQTSAYYSVKLTLDGNTLLEKGIGGSQVTEHFDTGYVWTKKRTLSQNIPKDISIRDYERGET